MYYPKSVWFGQGPRGMGEEYSMRPSHRAAVAEKKTTQMERPGPKYVLPTGLGGQVESTKRSANSGRFSECPRKTIELGPSRSSQK